MLQAHWLVRNGTRTHERPSRWVDDVYCPLGPERRSLQRERAWCLVLLGSGEAEQRSHPVLHQTWTRSHVDGIETMRQGVSEGAGCQRDWVARVNLTRNGVRCWEDPEKLKLRCCQVLPGSCNKGVGMSTRQCVMVVGVHTLSHQRLS